MEMHIAVAKLTGTTPYSQARYHATDKLDKESADDYERRTWRNKLHVNGDGKVFIPPMVFKNCLSEAAKFLGKQIPGKGKATYTKHFEAGVSVTDPVPLKCLAEEVRGEWVFVPASGVRGDGKRVLKCFPCIDKWDAEVTFMIFDPTITQAVFLEHLQEAGMFIGIGRFRPRNNGYFGRFRVDSMEWE